MPKKTTRAQHAPGYTYVGTYHGIEEHTLNKNGLKVLYSHDDTAPVVGVMVTYLVGSRHEAVGHTGATHLLEHLMFKGSKHFPPKKGVSVLDALSNKGALVNASTWVDRTNYYEVVPEEHAEYAISLEADRMRNAILTEKDREEEMPAVRSEFAMRVDNVPEDFLDEKIWATAFLAHPYHHPTIGWQDDFENVSIERLRHFYDTYYWPNNAVVTIIGAIPRKEALSLVKKHFGVHTKSPRPIPTVYTTEPPQTGTRTIEVERVGTKNIVGMAYKMPHALHEDTPTLLALASILSDGNTSRLHRALVEKKLCSSVHAAYMPFKDPSLMPFYATLAPGVQHEKVEQVIMREIETLQSKGIRKEELTKVLASLETEMAFARDGHYATLSALNEAIAAGDWRFFFDLPQKLKKVTSADVKRVAKEYLQQHTLTIGRYKTQQHL